MKKLVVTLLGVAIAVTAGFAGAGEVSAAPLPQINTNGDTVGTFGDHSFCRGAVAFRIAAADKKPGVVRITAISRGFLGEGPTWKQNPKCTFRIRSAYTSGRGLDLEKWTRVSFGPRPGEKKTWDVVTGSGPATIGLTTYAINTPVRVLQTPKGSTFFMLVP
ncbi:enoyl-CoA hydratase [Gordonia westfalica]|uniref:Enoyl-CoA hydratase n=1 Tax=Gordonia westfalica TaxID=158898 RepID=A0A1H2KGK7_9ACTN|nr:enoyl-CoA hydratase [Gordonia westfalica]SDU67837.1 hypothetical protein SAMN04488548_1343231 [Gordonia westfalica]